MSWQWSALTMQTTACSVVWLIRTDTLNSRSPKAHADITHYKDYILFPENDLNFWTFTHAWWSPYQTNSQYLCIGIFYKMCILGWSFLTGWIPKKRFDLKEIVCWAPVIGVITHMFMLATGGFFPYTSSTEGRYAQSRCLLRGFLTCIIKKGFGKTAYTQLTKSTAT